MIPTLRFALALAVAALLMGFSSRIGVLLPVSVALISLALALLAADWLMLARLRIEVARVCDEKLSLGAANPVHLVVRNASPARVHGVLRDEYPEGVRSSDNVLPLDLPPRAERDLLYHVTPPKRGNFEFGDTFVRVLGPFSMAHRQIRYATAHQVKVYPNLLDMRRYEIGLRRHREVQPGRRHTRTRGTGTDFESLRDYSPDDEFRAVDWKATARRGKLTTRQYQEERSQNIVILLDCGRTMGPIIDGLTRLDHSINAAMMLAHVAVLRGDRVGLLTFADDVLSFVAPRLGKSQLRQLLGVTYDLKDAEGDSNYACAFSYLTSRWTRRSLLVLFTDLIDPESSKPLLAQFANLARKHLSLCVAVADPLVGRMAYEPAENVEAAFISAAARQSIQARKLAAAQLRAAGAIVIDIEPNRFTPAVVDAYLDIKASARL